MAVTVPTINSPTIPSIDGGPAVAGGLTYTTVTLSAGSLVQDPNSAIDAATSYGATSELVMLEVDPGNISGTPDCVLWDWTIADPFDFDSNVAILMRLKLTGSPTSAWIIYLGLYDGTLGANQGLYGSIKTDNGATGAQTMGAQSTFGQASASVQANGGSLEVAFSLDPLGTPNPRGNMVRSYSNTGPAFGRTERSDNPSSWASSAVKGFLAFGATGTRDAGTFAGVEIQYLVIPRWT